MLRSIARGSPGTIWRRIYNVPNPAAGADLTFAVPAHRAWQLLAVSAKLTASAIAGNRFPSLILRDTAGITLARSTFSFNLTAAQANDVSWIAGLGSGDGNQNEGMQIGIPNPWYMMPQESLRLAGGTDAGDTWTNCRVTVIETNTGDPDYIDSIAQGIMDHGQAIFELVNGER